MTAAEDEFFVGIATTAAVDFHPCSSREEAIQQRALFAAVFPGATVWVTTRDTVEAYKPEAVRRDG